MNISSKTRVCAIIGNPVGHSLSPLIHNAAFVEKNLDIVYTAFCVSDLPGAIEGVRALGILGLSVTVPHKEAIIPLLDWVDPYASKIGAVNTVVNEDGLLRGYNTDAAGVSGALHDVPLKGASVLIFGAGGASRAAAFAVALDTGLGSLTLIDPVEGRAVALAADVRAKTGCAAVTGLTVQEADYPALIKKSDILINASPLGMHPNTDASPIVDFTVDLKHIIFDIVYTPRITRFIRQGMDAGARCITGDVMFLKQAECQFRLWTNKEASAAVMEAVLRKEMGLSF